MFGYSFFTFRVEIRNTLERTFGLEHTKSSSRTRSLGTAKNHKSKRVDPPPVSQISQVLLPSTLIFNKDNRVKGGWARELGSSRTPMWLLRH
jgi:hypothetical protein